MAFRNVIFGLGNVVNNRHFTRLNCPANDPPAQGPGVYFVATQLHGHAALGQQIKARFMILSDHPHDPHRDAHSIHGMGQGDIQNFTELKRGLQLLVEHLDRLKFLNPFGQGPIYSGKQLGIFDGNGSLGAEGH